VPSTGFRATLRPYQQAGLNWFGFLDSLRFGACLADDMGLGKTIQLLAFLSVKKNDNSTSLLVVPASLIANWSSEIDRFYPELVYHIAHPGSESTTHQGDLSQDDLSQIDLVITTYAMVQRYEWLQTFHWDYVILDEAQAIKNPGTKQTRAVKKLRADNRIILTGTPVENRLSDLWSLFDFLNPGLLGNLKEFRTFTKTLKDDPTGYGRLRTVISPYILRRLKTDQSIIDDLPEKVEMKTFASLTKKQIVLYRNLVDDIEAILANSEGIQRKGLILSSLLKFKQLCNHPDQFLGTGSFEEQHSGKFQRLRELCVTVQEKRERMLVFTQFRELTMALHDFLASIFGRSGVVLHGSVPVKQRKVLVDTFQHKDTYVPFMVLSLKAGGVGLNLTEANHVVHFDRWWNPAVENQATDRAFRIGQKKNVVVHKFITQGSIEEKIDAMLEEKARLSSEVIAASGEGWITELENDQLMELFSLSLT
jgi:non-specific serine/threonine protein kinase